MMKHDNAKENSWNQLFSNFISKNVDLTEKSWFDGKIVIASYITSLCCFETLISRVFCGKMEKVIFCNFHKSISRDIFSNESKFLFFSHTLYVLSRFHYNILRPSWLWFAFFFISSKPFHASDSWTSIFIILKG